MDSVFTDDERREIAGRARTLHERLDGPPNDPDGEPPLDPDRVLDEWRGKFPDEESFQARLDRDGLTEAAIREHVEATHWPAGEPLPDWIDDLEAMVEFVEATPEDERRDVDLPEDVAFVELLAAVTRYAHGLLPDLDVPMDAVEPMREGLATQLEMTSIRALYVEFKSFLEYHDPALLEFEPDQFDDPPTTYYDRFIDAMFERGFHNLCIEYPVLARNLVRLVDHWVDATVEVSRRLVADLPAIRDRFGVEGEVTALEPLTGDSHACGRVPVRVSFESVDVIYKPRPVDAGVAYYTILDRLNDHLPTPSFRLPEYLPRDDYGWMGIVDYREPDDEAGADRYYERAGSLVAIGYALNMTDCQLENIIVDGEYPMIIDAETMFHPHVDSSATPFVKKIHAVLDRSVLLTALLPWSAGDPRKADSEGLAAILAGLGSESGKTNLSDRTLPRVEAVNTDVMAVGPKEPEVDRSTNTPSIDGEDRPPEAHIDAVIRGFEQAYDGIQELHEEGRFFTEIADPELIADVENRLVYRATGKYVSVIRAAAARNPLRDGAMFTVEMEELAVPYFDGMIETDRHWPLYETERRALRRLDVPRLTSRADRSTVYHDDEPLGVSVDASGYDHSRRRLDSMDAADRDRQVWIIRHSFGVPPEGRTLPSAVEVTDDRLEREAIDLLDAGLDASYETGDDEFWVSISPASTTFTLVPAGFSIYHGRGGLAITAAALYDLTGRARYRQRIEEILAPLFEKLEADDPWFGLGGTMGAGSIVYTLSVVAELLDDDSYREHAREVAMTVTDDRLATDDVYDVMEGSSGTLLGLLGYYDRYGDEAVLERAVACGDRLLEARVEIDGYRVWREDADPGPPLTGFAHGSTGIAYSLARLAALVDEPRYEEAVYEALEFEASVFSPERNNWPTSSAGVRFQDRWCHGRSGMALGRIAIGECLGDDSLVEEAREVLATTATGNPSTSDQLCCGNLGRAEALLEGSRRAGCDVADATEMVGRCLARREQEGTLSMPGHAEEFVNPTFYDGAAGAAYTLLRHRNPDSLPCVLLFE